MHSRKMMIDQTIVASPCVYMHELFINPFLWLFQLMPQIKFEIRINKYKNC